MTVEAVGVAVEIAPADVIEFVVDNDSQLRVGLRAHPGFEPIYGSDGAAGADVRAHIEKSVVLAPRERRGVPTGVYVEIPPGYEAQVRPRSGLAMRHGITVLNAPGTIDSDYRGEIIVPIVNLGDQPFEITPGMRIAQLVFAAVERVAFDLSSALSETERGEQGFGSTGYN